MVSTNGSRSLGGDPKDSERPDWKAVESEALLAGRELLEVLRLRWQRLRLGTRERAHSLLLALWLAVVGVVASVVATGLLVLGLAGGVSDLFSGRPWIGRLLVGAAVLALAVGALRRMRTLMRRSFLEQLEQAEPAGPAGPVGPVGPVESGAQRSGR